MSFLISFSNSVLCIKGRVLNLVERPLLTPLPLLLSSLRPLLTQLLVVNCSELFKSQVAYQLKEENQFPESDFPNKAVVFLSKQHSNPEILLKFLLLYPHPPPHSHGFYKPKCHVWKIQLFLSFFSLNSPYE